VAEINLEELISRIKQDGVDSARQEAQRIIDAAQEQARQIQEQAREQAGQALEQARKETEQLRSNTQAELQKAYRDTVLKLKEEILEIFNRAFKQKVSQAFSVETVREMIVKIVQNWKPQAAQGVKLLLGEEDIRKLQAIIPAALKEAAVQTEIKVDRAITRGFRIGFKDEEVFYDFGDEAVAQALGEFLTPALKAVLDKAHD